MNIFMMIHMENAFTIYNYVEHKNVILDALVGAQQLRTMTNLIAENVSKIVYFCFRLFYCCANMCWW